MDSFSTTEYVLYRVPSDSNMLTVEVKTIVNAALRIIPCPQREYIGGWAVILFATLESEMNISNVFVSLQLGRISSQLSASFALIPWS